jgi:transcriptional regulator with XRE-family HTH domain
MRSETIVTQIQELQKKRLTPENARKTLFSQRLRSLMVGKAITVTALAKAVQQQVPGGKFNQVNISHYRSGRSLPRAQIMKALAEALGVDIEELAPSSGSIVMSSPEPSPSEKGLPIPDVRGSSAPEADVGDQASSAAPAFYVKDMEKGQAWIQINQRLSWQTVIKLLRVLNGEP